MDTWDKTKVPCDLHFNLQYNLEPECLKRLSKFADFLNKNDIECKVTEGYHWGKCYCLEVKKTITLDVAEKIYNFADRRDVCLPVEFNYSPKYGFGLYENGLD